MIDLINIIVLIASVYTATILLRRFVYLVRYALDNGTGRGWLIVGIRVRGKPRASFYVRSIDQAMEHPNEWL